MIKGSSRTYPEQIRFILQTNGASTTQSIAEEMVMDISLKDLHRILCDLVRNELITRTASSDGDYAKDVFTLW